MQMFEIQVENRNAVFYCGPDQPLLIAMMQQNIEAIDVGCRGGGCGFCKIRVKSGEYVAKKMSVKHVDSNEQRAGMALSCRAYPRSDMVIESDQFQRPSLI